MLGAKCRAELLRMTTVFVSELTNLFIIT